MSDVLYVNDAGILNVARQWNEDDPSLLLLGGGALMGLFKSNVVVSKATLIADLTGANEASFPGYARQAITVPPGVVVTAHVGAFLIDAVTFLCSGGGGTESEYGGFVLDYTGGALLCCWNFAAGPFVMYNNGDTIQISPTLSVQSLH
jgi:hypothetical protein